jgi:sugar phosphate isomerase/epimerase
MKIAVSGETPGRNYDLRQICEYIRGYGAAAIEIWPENIPAIGGKEVIHRLYKNRDLASAVKTLNSVGVETVCVAFGAALDRDLASDRDMYTRELVRAVVVAAELGASLVNHYLYYFSMTDTADLEVLRSLYGPAIEEAEKRGIYLVLENEAHDSTKNPLEMKRIVEGMGSSHFRTNFDVTNYYQASYEGYPYAYTILKDLISYVHVKDGCIHIPEHHHREETMGQGMSGFLHGKNIQYPEIGTGAVNLCGLLESLHHDHITKYCTIEPHTNLDYWHIYAKYEIEFLKKHGLTGTP